MKDKLRERLVARWEFVADYVGVIYGPNGIRSEKTYSHVFSSYSKKSRAQRDMIVHMLNPKPNYFNLRVEKQWYRSTKIGLVHERRAKGS